MTSGPPNSKRMKQLEDRPAATKDDEQVLRALGYEQELARRMSGFSNFAISLSIICILAGGITSFHVGLCSAGGARSAPSNRIRRTAIFIRDTPRTQSCSRAVGRCTGAYSRDFFKLDITIADGYTDAHLSAVWPAYVACPEARGPGTVHSSTVSAGA